MYFLIRISNSKSSHRVDKSPWKCDRGKTHELGGVLRLYCNAHQTQNKCLISVITLESAHECLLLVGSLEATVTELGAGVDELELDGLFTLAADVWDAWLAESKDTLADTDGGTLNDEEVVLDDTIVWEATHWVDALDSWVSST